MSDSRMLLLDEEICFRYRVVSAVLALELGGTKRQAAVCLVCSGPHMDEEGTARRVTERTVYRWLAVYRDEGLAGLEPRRRGQLEGSKVLSSELLKFLDTERQRDRDASIPELLRRAELLDIIPSWQALDRTTVWRVMGRLGIETRRRKVPEDADQRRFRYPLRMQMVLLDYKHFRAGPKRSKRAALYLLDDSSRFGLNVVVSTSEQPAVVLHALHEAIETFGLMDATYWDKGPGFRSLDVIAVCAKMDVRTIEGRARYPQGHGAIERFNRSAKARVLRSLDGAPDVDSDCAALTIRLRHDLFEGYNHLPHESLDNDTPYQRFHADPRPLRPAESAAWLRDRFTLTLERRASNDHIVQVDSINYEVPRGHAGEWVTLHRRLLEVTPETDSLYMHHQGRLVRIHPVDLALNARERRARPLGSSPEEFSPVPAKSASHLAFERDFPSMLQPDGGYTDPNDDKDPQDEQED